MNRNSFAAAALGALVSLALVGYGCSSGESVMGGGNGGGEGGKGGSSSTTGAGGNNNTTTGAGGNNTTTGAGGNNTTTGAGGNNTTTGAGGNTTTGAGGNTTGAGGSAGAGGTTTTGQGGATGTGGTGATCPSGIKSGTTACTTACGPKACGLADTGTTTCACTNSVYMCSACAFNIGAGAPPFLTTPPAATVICAAGVADKVPCNQMGMACNCDTTSTGCLTGVTSTSPQECACWLPNNSTATNAANPWIWDCDKKP